MARKIVLFSFEWFYTNFLQKYALLLHTICGYWKESWETETRNWIKFNIANLLGKWCVSMKQQFPLPPAPLSARYSLVYMNRCILVSWRWADILSRELIQSMSSGESLFTLKYENIWIVRSVFHACVARRNNNNKTFACECVAVSWCAKSNVHRKYQKLIKFSLMCCAHTNTTKLAGVVTVQMYCVRRILLNILCLTATTW